MNTVNQTPPAPPSLDTSTVPSLHNANPEIMTPSQPTVPNLPEGVTLPTPSNFEPTPVGTDPMLGVVVETATSEEQEVLSEYDVRRVEVGSPQKSKTPARTGDIPALYNHQMRTYQMYNASLAQSVQDYSVVYIDAEHARTLVA